LRLGQWFLPAHLRRSLATVDFLKAEIAEVGRNQIFRRAKHRREINNNPKSREDIPQKVPSM
jgi:hypothetical protein